MTIKELQELIRTSIYEEIHPKYVQAQTISRFGIYKDSIYITIDTSSTTENHSNRFIGPYVKQKTEIVKRNSKLVEGKLLSVYKIMKYYVYMYIDTENTPFYIGKGKND